MKRFPFYLLSMAVFSSSVSGQSILFPRIRCYAKLVGLGLDFDDFDSYDRYFRENSVMSFAQTGDYVGRDDIEEYNRIASAESNPFIAESSISGIPRFLAYEDGACKFLYMATIKSKTKHEDAELDGEYDIILLTKIYLDFDEGYLRRVNAFFPRGAMELFYGPGGINVNAERRNFTCNVLRDSCSSFLATPVGDDCEEKLDELPVSEGEDFYIDGDSEGCRSLHSIFAATNPENHCAHVSLEPQEDPQGRIKCQESKGRPVTDLFTEREFTMFRRYARLKRMDPEVGYRQHS